MGSTSIRVVVSPISCPALALAGGLRASTNITILSTRVIFTCDESSQPLSGPEQITCLPTGEWSAPIPACKQVPCPPIISLVRDPLVRVTETHHGPTEISFSCPPGHRREGPAATTCLPSGRWSLEVPPSCLPTLCPKPPSNPHSTLQPQHPGQVKFRAGDVVRYSCVTGYQMVGESVSACLKDGTWSRSPPECQRACTYPGSSKGLLIDKVQFYYKAEDSVGFSCQSPLQLVGSPLLKCLASGAWSGPLPSCLDP